DPAPRAGSIHRPRSARGAAPRRWTAPIPARHRLLPWVYCRLLTRDCTARADGEPEELQEMIARASYAQVTARRLIAAQGLRNICHMRARSDPYDFVHVLHPPVDRGMRSAGCARKEADQ